MVNGKGSFLSYYTFALYCTLYCTFERQAGPLSEMCISLFILYLRQFIE